MKRGSILASVLGAVMLVASTIACDTGSGSSGCSAEYSLIEGVMFEDPAMPDPRGAPGDPAFPPIRLQIFIAEREPDGTVRGSVNAPYRTTASGNWLGIEAGAGGVFESSCTADPRVIEDGVLDSDGNIRHVRAWLDSGHLVGILDIDGHDAPFDAVP